MVVFSGANDNIHSACRYAGTSGANLYALELASLAAGNVIATGTFMSFDQKTPFLFTSDGGSNVISATGFCTAGGATSFGGTQAASTRVTYVQGGTVINVSPPVSAPSGSASAPGHSFASDTNTGGFNPSADNYGIATNGVEALRVDGSQRILKGSATSVTFGSTTPSVQIHGSDNNAPNLGIANWANDSTQPIIRALKSRGATVGTHGLVLSGDTVLNIDGFASDGSAFNRMARIKFEIDGTTGVGDMPGRITFFTSLDGFASDVERLRIDNAGALIHRNNATTIVDGSSHLGLRSYTVATLPSASSAARMIYVSDGTSNKRLAVSDGTNWRFPDGAIVS
jgi:hypothetical protein